MGVFICVFAYLSIAIVKEMFMNLRRRPGRNWSEIKKAVRKLEMI